MPRHGRQRFRALAPVLFGALLLAGVACGGDSTQTDDEEGLPLPSATPSIPAATHTATAPPVTATATEEPATTTSPVATPDSPGPSGEVERATTAAAEAVGGAAVLETLDRAACEAAAPASRICIALQSSAETVERGLARFNAGDLDGGGFLFFMGRGIDGAWGYWFGTQQQFDALETLPGTLLACGGGSDVQVRLRPAADADVQGSVLHESELSTVEFALAAPGSFAAGGSRGGGWYRVIAPIEGWVSADDVTDAALGDCLLHEELRANRG